MPVDAGVASSEEVTRARDDRAIARALRILERRACAPGPTFGDVATCGAFFRLRLGNETREHFEAAFLDAQHRLIAVERLFSGSVDGAEVRPRIVVQRALALNAAAVMVAHNHPSGHSEPSTADRAVTVQLTSALRLVEIRLLDHFVVTASQAVSMAARGLV
ncbi:JAB domain-containing protein [Pseudoxanthomonas wuyuanensis]|uniref:JAB domain-containing protein n=1 Tax=Pseudoxanthomonas wuyuanensis TaxID=1073196 RepID=UPI001EE40DB1|nr:JAB domain-containing protein [Pseudoxanthomonas wuyuanensis]